MNNHPSLICCPPRFARNAPYSSRPLGTTPETNDAPRKAQTANAASSISRTTRTLDKPFNSRSMVRKSTRAIGRPEWMAINALIPDSSRAVSHVWFRPVQFPPIRLRPASASIRPITSASLSSAHPIFMLCKQNERDHLCRSPRLNRLCCLLFHHLRVVSCWSCRQAHQAHQFHYLL